jgi:putative SOS response-associated peptidase YedK
MRWRPIHDRVPEVLDKVDIRTWLNGEAGTELLKAGRRGSPPHVVGVEARQQDGHWGDDATLLDEVAA